ncbi:MAG: hypothetical protein C9356_04790 [Oleiphilus sp.]|nr:MAG: hypothetical protein C9356_04790 [Oleiphilus sp.]
MTKFTTMIAALVLAGCETQALITPISHADNDQTQTWIFIEKPAGDLKKNGIYHCSSGTGEAVCKKASVVN